MIRNIIWDVDGTLFDTYPAFVNSFQAALADLGKSASYDWIENLAKRSMSFCESTMAAQFQLSEEDIDRKFDEYYSQISYADQPPFPGVTAICEYICSIGGKNVVVTHRGKLGTLGLLETHHLSGLFTGCLTEANGFPRKPSPAAFLAACHDYALIQAETIAVGDRDIDVLAGKAAGVRTCLFGVSIIGLEPDLTVNDFGELLGYLVAENS
jgi:phosphoglycolate phosphatase-like HAD superfamily hydrolase